MKKNELYRVKLLFNRDKENPMEANGNIKVETGEMFKFLFRTLSEQSQEKFAEEIAKETSEFGNKFFAIIEKYSKEAVTDMEIVERRNVS